MDTVLPNPVAVGADASEHTQEDFMDQGKPQDRRAIVAISPENLKDKNLLIRALVYELNSKILLSKYRMNSPTGTWDIIPFELELNSGVRAVFEDVQAIFDASSWSIAKIIDSSFATLMHRGRRYVLPDPVRDLLQQILDEKNNQVQIGYFQMNYYALVLFRGHGTT